MKKIIIGIIAIITLLLLVIGGMIYLSKTNESDNAIIMVSEEVWWPNDQEQKIETINDSREYEIKKGNIITINQNWEKSKSITLEIITIKKDYIIVKTSEELSDTGGVFEGKKEFKIERGKKINLNTLTLDAGATYKIEMK